MRNNYTRSLIGLSFFCLMASSAFAGGIKHPSDYGDPSTGITFGSCGSQQIGLVVADCFNGTGEGSNDFLFSFSLATPVATTSITSVTLNLTFNPSDLNTTDPFGLLESQTPGDCSKMNIACTPPQVTFLDPPATLVDGSNTFSFNNFAGNLTVTEYFSFEDAISTPSFTGDTTSSSVTTPEPSEIGFLIAAAFGSVIVARRRQQAK
jgi:hypothetical protein